MAPQTAISKAVCYKTKNEQLWEKAVHFLLVATNCFYAGLPTVFCTITHIVIQKSGQNTKKPQQKHFYCGLFVVPPENEFHF